MAITTTSTPRAVWMGNPVQSDHQPDPLEIVTMLTEILTRAASAADLSFAVSGLEYQGIWDADANSPTLPAAAGGNDGHFYVVGTDGTTTIDGVSDWVVGDYLISDGSAWHRVRIDVGVVTVAGRSGVVTLAISDISDATAAGQALVTAANAAAQKALLALENVDNTSDADKPVSTAQQTALDGKLDADDATLTGDATAENLTVSGALNAGLTPFLNQTDPTTSSLDTMTILSPQRIIVTEETGGTASWDLDQTYASGTVLWVYVRILPGTDDRWTLYYYNPTDGSAVEFATVNQADGGFHLYKVTAPANGISAIRINCSGERENVDITLCVLPENGHASGTQYNGTAQAMADSLMERAKKKRALGTSDFAGKVFAFDGGDVLPSSGGRLRTWASDDGATVLTQTDPDMQPTQETEAGAVSFPYKSMSRRSTSTLAQTYRLPDSSVAANPGGGFTCTGMDRTDDGLWIIANDGRTDEADTTYSPSIVILSSDFSRIIDELDMSAAYTTPKSIQGVAWDSTDNTIWFCDKLNQKVRHCEMDGTLIGTAISLAYEPNGLAYDATADELYIARDSDATIEIYDASTDTKDREIEAVYADIDQMHHDGEYLYTTTGSNGSPGSVFALDPATGKFAHRFYEIENAEAIEGVVVDRAKGKMWISNDGAFHTAADPAISAVFEYDIPVIADNAYCSELVFGALLRRNSIGDTYSGVLIGGGDALADVSDSYDGGWAVLLERNSDVVRLYLNGTTAGAIDWVVDARSDDVLLTLVIEDETSATLYLNGVSQSVSASTITIGNYDHGFSVGEFSVGGNLDGTLKNNIDATVYGLMLSSDADDREYIEGYLAWRHGREDLLPSGHTYEDAAPQ